ncbi:MAG: hypothetical protein WC907_04240 [Acholeplasmataceae bacterium]
MKQLIEGKYFYQGDFIFEITESNKISILNEIKKIIEIEKEHLIENYRQGFIQVYTETQAIKLNSELDYLYRLIFNEIFNLVNLKDALRSAKKHFLKKDDIIYSGRNVFKKLYNEIISRVYVMLMDKKTAYFLKFKHLTLNIIFNLPDNVKALVFDKNPPLEFKEALKAKNIFFIVTPKKLITNKIYYINIFNQEIIEEAVVSSFEYKMHKKNNLILGQNICLAGENQIAKEVDFILVESDRAYLLSKGMISYKARSQFYKELYQKNPNRKIIISLPKLDVLFKYHYIDNDYLFDEVLLSKYFYLYELELKSIFSHYHENIMICLPPVVDDTEFKYIKLQIHTYITSMFKRKVKLGLSLETETSFEYIEYYKKYDFVLMNIDRLTDETEILENMNEAELIKEISHINQRLKIKFKPLYIMGYPIYNFNFYQKLVRKGFKNFIVPRTHIEEYYRFNQNEI